MKRFMSICGVLLLIFIIIGAALCGIATMVKGQDFVKQNVRNVTKEKTGFQISFGDGDVYYDIDDNMIFNKKYDIMSGDIEKKRIDGTVKNLQIDAGGCVLKFEKSDDEYFYYEATKVDKLQVYVDDDTCFIKSSSGAHTWDNKGFNRITLYIPENVSFREVNVEFGAGILEFGELIAEDIRFEVGAGEVTGKKLEAGSLKASIGAGSLEIEDIVTDTVEASVNMGNLSLGGQFNGNVEAECAMGNIDLKVQGKESDFDYDIEVSMGNLDLGKDSYSGMTFDKEIQNDAEKTMTVNCSMGNVTISFTE